MQPAQHACSAAQRAIKFQAHSRAVDPAQLSSDGLPTLVQTTEMWLLTKNCIFPNQTVDFVWSAFLERIFIARR